MGRSPTLPLIVLCQAPVTFHLGDLLYLANRPCLSNCLPFPNHITISQSENDDILAHHGIVFCQLILQLSFANVWLRVESGGLFKVDQKDKKGK